jgi:hypothetical protein
MIDLATNVLYYGDNLDILRRYLPDAAVDLVYLDPPFNSNRDYNVIFRDESGNATDAQLLAFEDNLALGSIGRGDLATSSIRSQFRFHPRRVRTHPNRSLALGRRSWAHSRSHPGRRSHRYPALGMPRRMKGGSWRPGLEVV